MKLNSLVSVPDRDIERGRVVQEINYLNGSTHFTVGTMIDKEYSHQLVHEWDMTLLEEGDRDAPAPARHLPLGANVKVKLPQARSRLLPTKTIEGVITAHVRSSSGCVEYEVAIYVPGKGPDRKLFEEQLLEREATATIPPGKEGGSHTRTLGTR